MNTTLEPESRPAPAPKVSVWEDFADIFFEPSSVFARRRDGGFLLVFIILTLIIGALSWAWMGAMEPAFRPQIERGVAEMRAQNPGVTEEQIAAGRAMMMVAFQAIAVIALPLIVLFTGFGIWLLGKLFDSAASFKTALMIATYAQFPRVLKSAVEVVQAMLFDISRLNSPFATSLSAARFMDPDEVGLVMLNVAARFDVFIIWMTVLIGIGVHVAGRVSKRNAAIIAFLIWLIGGLFAVGGAARGGG